MTHTLRRPIVAGNWKMNGTLKQASSIAREVLRACPQNPRVEVVLCPPFTALATVGEILGKSPILLGAQNIHWESKGAFTGEISGPMLKELGCRYVIVGHSERRQLFGETDAAVAKRLRAALDNGLIGILCVGETLEQRKQGKTWTAVEAQLKAALDGVEATASSQLVIAYEPVWAIGTGQNATAAQAQEVHGKIRNWVAERFSRNAADGIRIQYGGSVKPDNAAELMAQPDVDGALVGGASIDPKAFISIIESTLQTKEAGCSTASS